MRPRQASRLKLDSIGFNRIPDEILRHLVIARVSHPKSKLATVDYLKSLCRKVNAKLLYNA